MSDSYSHPEHDEKTKASDDRSSLLMRVCSFFPESVREFIKFGIIGGSGTIVNMVVVVVLRKLWLAVWGIEPDHTVFSLFGTDFHVRWFHIFMTIAFVVANTWNFQLNRLWTFQKAKRNWWSQFFSFLLTGLGSLIVTQVVATLLMNPTSPIALSLDVFDSSSGFRTPFYWAAAISIIVAMPVNFVVNKLWTFRKK